MSLRPFTLDCPPEMDIEGRIVWEFVTRLAQAMPFKADTWSTWCTAEDYLSDRVLSYFLHSLYVSHGYDPHVVRRFWQRAAPLAPFEYPTPPRLYDMVEKLSGLAPTWMLGSLVVYTPSPARSASARASGATAKRLKRRVGL